MTSSILAFSRLHLDTFQKFVGSTLEYSSLNHPERPYRALLGGILTISSLKLSESTKLAIKWQN